jgi:hypothetical protein
MAVAMKGKAGGGAGAAASSAGSGGGAGADAAAHAAPGSKKPGLGDAGVMPQGQNGGANSSGGSALDPITDGMLKAVEAQNKRMAGGGGESAV